MTKHAPATPLPWHLGTRQAEQIVYDGKGWAVANATVYHGHADGAETKANAAYIAHACNKYPQLVQALRAMMEQYSVAHDSQTEARLLEQGNAGAVGRALLRSLGEE